MKRFLTCVLLIAASFWFAQAQQFDLKELDKVFGKTGTLKGDVYKVTFPRTDLSVKIGDVSLDPGLALTSWIAFRAMDTTTMMMGDLVLLESEISSVEKKLVENSIEVSAIHNHLVGEEPKIMYMHFEGKGDPPRLAEKMKTVLAQTGTPMVSASSILNEEIDWSQVESILRYTGQHKGKLLQFGIPRSETIKENGMDIPPYMGMATTINMQKVGEKAATTGDFVLLADEVNPIVKVLTENDIAVTAIHNHMLNESPRLFMLHFWGVDAPEKLAHGLRSALDKISSVKK
jgi:hypothetical protein